MGTTLPPHAPWRTIPSDTLHRGIWHPAHPWSSDFVAQSLISSAAFVHRGVLRQHKYSTDLGGHTIQDSFHSSSCNSLIRFYGEVSAVSCLQSQHKSVAKAHHAYSYCAKWNPGVSTPSLQPQLAVIHWAQRETFVILPEILYTVTLVKTTRGVNQHIFIAVSGSILTEFFLPFYLWSYLHFWSCISCLVALLLPVVRLSISKTDFFLKVLHIRWI